MAANELVPLALAQWHKLKKSSSLVVILVGLTLNLSSENIFSLSFSPATLMMFHCDNQEPKVIATSGHKLLSSRCCCCFCCSCSAQVTTISALTWPHRVQWGAKGLSQVEKQSWDQILSLILCFVPTNLAQVSLLLLLLSFFISFYLPYTIIFFHFESSFWVEIAEQVYFPGVGISSSRQDLRTKSFLC